MAKKQLTLELGAQIDAHHELYLKRKLAEFELQKAKIVEQVSCEVLLAAMKAAGIGGARGVHGQVKVSRREFIEILDYPKLCAYIRKNNAFDLLHRRVSIEAVRARMESTTPVPPKLVSIGAVPILKVSTVKQGGR